MLLRALLAAAAVAVAAPALAQSDQGGGQPGQGQGQNPAWQQNREAMRKACATDIQTYCSNLPEGTRPGQCLRQNADKLSPDCKDALAKMRSMMQQRPQ